MAVLIACYELFRILPPKLGAALPLQEHTFSEYIHEYISATSTNGVSNETQVRDEDEARSPSIFPTVNLPLTLPVQVSPRLPEGISDKLQNFLQLAKKHGYDWAWIDTACIDKTNSAELTEAINSMFRYYTLADVCYAYLSDLPPLHDFDAHRPCDHNRSLCEKVRLSGSLPRGRPESHVYYT